MPSTEPCDACKEQVKKRLYDDPHPKLSRVWSQEFRGGMFGGHEEYCYQCIDCGSLIYHMYDKNDVMPFWYFVDKVPGSK
jgi:hypothetical protein